MYVYIFLHFQINPFGVYIFIQQKIAFQTKNNDKLKELEQYKGLRWVSVGKPEIVKLNNQLFGQNKLSFFIVKELFFSSFFFY